MEGGHRGETEPWGKEAAQMKLERLETERDSWIYNILWQQENQTLKLGKGEFTHSTNIEDQQTQSPRIYSMLHPQGFKMAEDPMEGGWGSKALKATSESK